MKRFCSIVAAVIFAFLPFAAFAQTSVIQSINNLSNKAETYTVTSQVTLATNPSAFFNIVGSATRTVYVKNIEISCVQTTGANVKIGLIKRTTATTGGTSSTVTPAVNDSGNAAATAVVRTWTANASSFGTGVSLTGQYLSIPAPGTITDSRALRYNWGEKQDQYLVLRGVAQALEANFSNLAVSGGICNITASWMER